MNMHYNGPGLKYVTYVYEVVDAAKWGANNPFNLPDRDGLHVLGVSCSDLMGVTTKIEGILTTDKTDEEKIAHIKTIMDGRFP